MIGLTVVFRLRYTEYVISKLCNTWDKLQSEFPHEKSLYLSRMNRSKEDLHAEEKFFGHSRNGVERGRKGEREGGSRSTRRGSGGGGVRERIETSVSVVSTYFPCYLLHVSFCRVYISIITSVRLDGYRQVYYLGGRGTKVAANKMRCCRHDDSRR